MTAAENDEPPHPWLAGLAEAEERDEVTYAEALDYLLGPTPRGLPAPVYERARRWLVDYVDLFTGDAVFAPRRAYDRKFPTTIPAGRAALAPLIAKLVEISVLEIRAKDRAALAAAPAQFRWSQPSPKRRATTSRRRPRRKP